MEEPEGFRFPFPSAERDYNVYVSKPEVPSRRRHSKHKKEREAIVGTSAAAKRIKSKQNSSRRCRKLAIAFFCFLLLGGATGVLLYFFLLQDVVVGSDLCNYFEEPTAYDILKCEKYRQGVSCSFDTTQCTTTCDLGYVQNQYGCQINCDCALGGIMQTDITFNPINIQSVLNAYISEEDSSIGRLSEGTVLQKNIWDLYNVAGRWRIPYIISDEIVTGSLLHNAVQEATAAISNKTCIDFFPKVSEIDFIEFSSFGHGCRSAVGRIGGKQSVALGTNCNYSAVIQHQLLHVLGFWHEDSRPDRDDYVIVNLDNVAKKNHFNFKEMGRMYFDNLSIPYDVNSIMHLDGFALSENNKATIVNKTSGKPIKARRSKLSEDDIKRIKKVYDCPDHDFTVSMDDVDHHWSEWTGWFPCSATCGTGHRVRLRECLDLAGELVWQGMCQGENRMYKKCGESPCNNDLWAPWSSCSVSCGIGQKHRTSCCYPLERYEIASCGLAPCLSQEEFSWGLWLSWLPCSNTCGRGFRKRKRRCVDRFYETSNITMCPQTVPSHQESELCATESCNVTGFTGTLSEWGIWSDCSLTCGNGQMRRERTCSGNCDGIMKTETRSCGDPCPITGSWGDWSEWSNCLVQCVGDRERQRRCYYLHNQIVPTCEGGNGKSGRQREIEPCTPAVCVNSTSRMSGNKKLNGWTPWTLWSGCSKTCMSGVQWRIRKCFSQDGFCRGRSSEMNECNTEPCIKETSVTPKPKSESSRMTNQWSEWTGWSHCSVTCGRGQTKRTRVCDGKCVGHKTEAKLCEKLCPVGTWSVWSQWTSCPTDCKGTTERRRTCSHDNQIVATCSEENGGQTDEENEEENCVPEMCATDDVRVPDARYNLNKAEWGSWSTWSHCSKSCLSGVQWRLRNCVSSRKDCLGRSTEGRICNNGGCTKKDLQPQARTTSFFDTSTNHLVASSGFCNGTLLLGDLNADQIPDLVCHSDTGYMSVKLARNRLDYPSVTWEAMTSFCLYGVVIIADFEGDGRDDVICYSSGFSGVEISVVKWVPNYMNHTDPIYLFLPGSCDTSTVIPGSFDVGSALDFACIAGGATHTLVLNP